MRSIFHMRLILLGAPLLCACHHAPSDVPVASARFVSAGTLGGNVLDGRVDGYDPSFDYLPDKAAFRHARQIRVEYRGHYKLVTFTPNVRGDVLKYLLAQRGTPTPDIPERREPLTKTMDQILRALLQPGKNRQRKVR